MKIKDRFSFRDLEVYSIYESKKNNIDLSYFHCEKSEFNGHYFNVLQRDDSNGLGKAFLFVYDKKVVGYLVLSMSQLNKSMHKDLGHISSVSNIPSLLIGRMTRHIDYKEEV